MLLYLVTQNLPGLRLSPPRVKEEREHLPGWLSNYSYSRLNCNTIPLTELLSVKYGRSLDCLLRKKFVNLARGYFYMLKSDISNGFYRISLRPINAQKLGLVFLVDNGVKPLVAIPFTPPM